MPNHRIPEIIEPYICGISQGSLNLVTSTHDATGNWLVLRFLHASLNRSGEDLVGKNGGQFDKVVFVSFLRSFDFWKGEARRALVSRQIASFLDKMLERRGSPCSFLFS